MKNKARALLMTSMCIFSITLSSCSFEEIFGTKLKSIEISDTNKAYLIGEIFDNVHGLTITGHYSNGTSKAIAYKDLTINLNIAAGGSHSSNTPFAVMGEYKLTVSEFGVTSNELTFNVLQEHVYASSISLTGPSTLSIWNEVELTTSVSPSNYTAPISYEASDDKIVKLTKTDTGVIVYATAGGEVDITAKVASSKTTYVTSTLHMSVDASISATKMSQTYNDYVKHNYFRISACPSIGDPELLVIPVWFNDSAKYVTTASKENLRSDIYNAYFGTSDSTGWESVSSYYYKESGGALNLKGKVSEWYSADIDAKTAGSYNSTNTVALVKKAVDWYFNSHTEDSRLNYDYDKDGYLDGVILIYAAPDNQASSASSDYDNLWAYCFWIQESAVLSKPRPNVFFWASYDFMYGKEKAYSRAGSSYSNGDTSHCTIDAHTYIHEMGHVLGLDDYYDYGGYRYEPAGGFSMQDCNVGGHDPFSVLSLGWASAYIPSQSIEITLRSFQSSHEMILLTPEWNSYNSPFDEYILLELYTPDGLNAFDTDNAYCGSYPQGSSSVGVRMWHVDARLYNRASFTKFYSDATTKSSAVAFTNTYYCNEADLKYVTDLYSVNEKYADFNLLQLIRNNVTTTYKPTTVFSGNDLFKAGSSFNILKYASQFYNGSRLNNGVSFPWSFEVKEISTNESGETYAKISLTRS